MTKYITVAEAEWDKLAAALSVIAECEIGFEGIIARKALGIPEPAQTRQDFGEICTVCNNTFTACTCTMFSPPTAEQGQTDA